MPQPLPREEYVEQAYLFRALAERLDPTVPIQDLLAQTREELLATTKAPLAVDVMLTELKHNGLMGEAMRRLKHYFAPFQAFILSEAENHRGRFDVLTAIEILRHEALYRSESPSQQGLFLYQFEVLCRNRLVYDRGLLAMSQDPAYNADWQAFLNTIRRQMGMFDLADMIYVRSAHYIQRQTQMGKALPGPDFPPLFGEKEGRIALANRRKDPLYLFSAMQRHLGYPAVPRRKKFDDSQEQMGLVVRKLERIEARLKILDGEQRGGLDLQKFYKANAARAPKPPDDIADL
jgi:hypothetical protein